MEKRYVLGVPKIGCRTGNEQAEACLRTLDDWGFRTSESSSWYMVYDITASNTRLKNDAGTFIENSNLARINLDDFRLLCSAGSSKAGHTLTRRQMKWLPTTSLMHKHTALREEMVKFCKAALGGSHQ